MIEIIFQVVWNFIGKLSDPQNIHSLFSKEQSYSLDHESNAHSQKVELKTTPIQKPVMSEQVKIESTILEENQSPANVSKLSCPDEVKRPIQITTTNFKLSTDKIDTNETNTEKAFSKSLLDRRDSFRLSFHKQGTISSALGKELFHLLFIYHSHCDSHS